ARHENNLRRATRRIGEDIGALRESGSRCVFLPVYEGELLTRKNKSNGTLVLERSTPRLGSLCCVGRTNERYEGNGSEPAQLLDRLMRRSVFAEPDRVVRVDVDDMALHETCKPNWRPHVIRKNEKCRTVRNEAAVNRHAVHDGAHS